MINRNTQTHRQAEKAAFLPRKEWRTLGGSLLAGSRSLPLQSLHLQFLRALLGLRGLALYSSLAPRS